MKKTRLKISIRKGISSWTVRIGHPIHPVQVLRGFPDEESAARIGLFIAKVFMQGMHQEFKENTKKSQRLMRKFGL